MLAQVGVQRTAAGLRLGHNDFEATFLQHSDRRLVDLAQEGVLHAPARRSHAGRPAHGAAAGARRA